MTWILHLSLVPESQALVLIKYSVRKPHHRVAVYLTQTHVIADRTAPTKKDSREEKVINDKTIYIDCES